LHEPRNFAGDRLGDAEVVQNDHHGPDLDEKRHRLQDTVMMLRFTVVFFSHNAP
jgi:hypothetical protein